MYEDADAGVESERRLATVQEIVAVEPIPGADRIERVVVLGWECVSQKGDFKPGDKCCYFEINSILPPHAVFDFMADRKYRVRTIKFRGQVAQGLAMPLNVMEKAFNLPPMKIGANLTGLIGVLKYDPQAVKERGLSTSKPDPWIVKQFMHYAWFRWLRKALRPNKGGWPSFISKTDEERVQNMPRVAQRNAGEFCYITEKLDGQSATFGWKGRHFYVCSRNIRLYKPDTSNYWKIVKQLDLKAKLKRMRGYIIQGEILGSNIQGNKYGLAIGEHHLYVYNVFNTNTGRKLGYDERGAFLAELGLNPVPLINGYFVLDADMTVADFVELSNGKSLVQPGLTREGIVIRSMDDRLSFKSVSPDFLLEYGDDR